MTVAPQPLTSRLHKTIIEQIIATGHAPTMLDLTATMGEPLANVREGLVALEQEHGVVMDPASNEVWLIHPFSMTPSLYWVEQRGQGWWAPCAWCALGVATLVGDCVISTRIAGYRELTELAVTNGVLSNENLFVQFTTPVRKAWKNVHRFCSTTLVFESKEQVEAWNARHGFAPGAVVPIETVAALAKAWYEGHLRADWRKHTREEARQIFSSVGLADPFWSVDPGKGRFLQIGVRIVPENLHSDATSVSV